MKHLFLLFLVALLWPTRSLHAAPPRQLWLYYPVNLAVDKNIDRLEAIWKRAADAGYDHVLLDDSKFTRLGSLNPSYFDNVRRVRQIARQLKLTLIPAVVPIGYSNDLLSNDPNLAEGLPVRDAPFLVHDGRIVPAPQPEVALEHLAFKDDEVQLTGRLATVSPGHGNARFVYQIHSPPDRCWHVSVWIKTDGFSGDLNIEALQGKRSLQGQSIQVQPTQDWKRCDVVFDSLDGGDIRLYFGVWGKHTGSLQWKDWTIEPAPPVNILRRDGTPLAVRREDGTPCVEGRDFDPVHDPLLGEDPYAGQYTAWHQPPILRTPLPQGTKLLLGWYYAPVIHDDQVCICMSDPQTAKLLAEQARRIKALFDADGYMMSYDEIRVANWDRSCQDRRLTPGQILADSAKQSSALYQPAQVYVWSDMFDPHHNAVPGPYYLVNGPWTGSWNGLNKEVILINWNYAHRDQSLKFFADRGHRQIIAAYYDGDMNTGKWLQSAGAVQGVVGVMYTTWKHDYSHIEQLAREVRRDR